MEAPVGIFGVPLEDSIKYANVAISLTNEQGESYVYGYVPIVIAKCGVYLKEKGMEFWTASLSSYMLMICRSYRRRGHFSSQRLCQTHQRTSGDFRLSRPIWKRT